MDTDKEDPGNFVHGKLMQSYTNNSGTTAAARPEEDLAQQPFDLKIEIYIKKHGFRGKSSGGCPIRQYRADLRKCCLCACLVFLLLVLLSVGIFLIVFFTRRQTAEAVTSLGVIHGQVQQSPQGTEVEEYLGIPFAKPPIGELRYNDPEPVGPFSGGSYDAVDHKYACMQFLDETYGNFQGSDMWNAKNKLDEDCLYLNIWVPKPKKENRAVLVWIYGGGFYGGSNSLWVYDGKALAAHGDVIVASMNYRTGSFGFFSTGDDRIKGNFGLKDQRVALEWIRDNIEAFGGDPQQVTVFGESSGAASVGYHMMSPASHGLFRRSIFESGSPDSHWSFMTKKQAKTRSKALLEIVGCPDDDNVLECLRKLPATDILKNEWVDTNFMVFPWAPTVDGDFLKDTPYNLLKAGKFELKDSMLGVNKDEGTFWLLYGLESMKKETESLHTQRMFNEAVEVVAWDLLDATQSEIRREYRPSNTSDTAAFRDALDDITGDRAFTCPTTELTDFLIKSGIKSYFYYLTYRSSTEVWPPWMGVIHGAEIQWIFGMPENKTKGYTDEEIQLGRDIMSYWVNFAKYGDPNGPGLPAWPQYTQRTPAFLEMKSPEEFIARYDAPLRSEYCQLWTNVNRKKNEDTPVR